MTPTQSPTMASQATAELPSSAFNIPAFGRVEAEAMMEEYGYCKHSDCRELVLAAHARGRKEALAAPTPPVDAVPGEPVVLDGCELCNGRRGGVPGNENIIDGKRVCDYCHSDSVAVPGEPMVLDELRATICGVGIVGQIDGDDVIRRESVIDLIDRRRLAASVASRAGSEPVAWEVLILGEWRPTRFPDELRAKGYEVRIALPDRERAASLVASEGLSIAQEPKYTVNGSAIMNRASGEAIPADEPVFIFRARDVRAVGALSRYASVVALHSSEDHWLAVMGRIDDFVRFRRDHPERMKEPDTDRASAEEAQS